MKKQLKKGYIENMYKSLLIAVDFPPLVGGIATLLYNIWKRLPSDQFVILAPEFGNYKELDKKEKYKIYRFCFPLGYGTINRILRSLFLIIYTLFLVKKEKINLLICGSPVSPGIVGLVIKKIFNVPYVIFAYGGETLYYSDHPKIIKFMKFIINNADLIVADSQYTKNEFEKISSSQKNFSVITPGVDIDIFKPEEKNKELAQRYNLENKKVLLTVARLAKRKGHDIIIKILSEIIEKVPNLVYIIVGTGPEEQNLKKLAHNLSLENNIIFTGYVKDEEIPKYYNLCDIFIMLSKEMKGDWHTEPIEGFGISFLEASACAKPVVAGRSGGTEDAVIHNESGFLVNPEDKKEIKEVILKLLKDEKLAKEIGCRGRKRVEAEFNWDKIVLKLEKIVENKFISHKWNT